MTSMFERFRVVNSFPALYDAELDAAIISDLHLGLESLMTKNGTYMPRFQLSDAKEDIAAIVEETGASRLIVCGDVKHEFSETTYGEREEVQELLDFLAGLVDETLLVKGNHDNYLIYPVKEYDNVQLEDFYVLDDVLFLHGHKMFENLKAATTEYMVMGHEHPTLALTDDVGVTEKLHCFLYGKTTDGRKLVVMPAFTSFAEGTPMNRVNDNDPDLLSPILEKLVDVQDMKAVTVDREAGVFKFPEVGNI